MKDESAGLTVTILGKEFMVACPPDERAALLAAAVHLDRKMREVQATGKVLGAERTAIMAALNITHELLVLRARGAMSDETIAHVKILQQKIDVALNRDVHSRQ